MGWHQSHWLSVFHLEVPGDNGALTDAMAAYLGYSRLSVPYRYIFGLLADVTQNAPYDQFTAILYADDVQHDLVSFHYGTLDVNHSERALSSFLVRESVVPVPEPTTLALFGAGLFGLGALRRRKVRKSA